MSAFLGPIHYWLYNKIRQVINREQMLYEQSEALCGNLAEEIREQIWQSYGQPLLDKDLTELIDQSNIHGWLQRQINIAESREAAFISEIIMNCGERGRDLVRGVFQEHGTICGQMAKEQGRHDSNKADTIYKAINDFYLNGMPCDQADMVVESSHDKLVWEASCYMQEPNWKRAGSDPNTMKEFYKTWLASFVEAMNPAFGYNQSAVVYKDHVVIRHEIVRTK